MIDSGGEPRKFYLCGCGICGLREQRRLFRSFCTFHSCISCQPFLVVNYSACAVSYRINSIYIATCAYHNIPLLRRCSGIDIGSGVSVCGLAVKPNLLELSRAPRCVKYMTIFIAHQQIYSLDKEGKKGTQPSNWGTGTDEYTHTIYTQTQDTCILGYKLQAKYMELYFQLCRQGTRRGSHKTDSSIQQTRSRGGAVQSRARISMTISRMRTRVLCDCVLRIQKYLVKNHLLTQACIR